LGQFTDFHEIMNFACLAFSSGFFDENASFTAVLSSSMASMGPIDAMEHDKTAVKLVFSSKNRLKTPDMQNS